MKFCRCLEFGTVWSHSLRGLCGLKSLPLLDLMIVVLCHSLRGLCGLKSLRCPLQVSLIVSQPARAVWIEISVAVLLSLVLICHSLRGLCGLKCLYFGTDLRPGWSQPARAVWIEISQLGQCCAIGLVTACEGCVD